MKGFTTKALHARNSKKDPHGALRTPIYDNAAYEYDTSEEFSDVALGKSQGHVYSRSSNPTVDDFEFKVKTLSNALGVISFASGMAALSTTILTLVKSGESIITTKYLFGHTLAFFQNTLPNIGIKVKFVDILNEKEVEEAIDDKTRLVFLETISNPQLQVANIKNLSKITKAKNIPLVVDTTMTPFYLFNAKEFGVDIEVLSSTKFISGGGTSVGGLIIDHGSFNWKGFNLLNKYYEKVGQEAFIYKARKEIFQGLGATLSPQSAYLQTLGLETLRLRIDKACQNSIELAQWLTTKEGIKNVNYPGLKDSPFYEISKKQFIYPSSILTFELNSEEEAFTFMNKLRIIRRATNIHDNKSLIVSPYHIIFPFNSHEEKMNLNIPPYMLRLSVGIEEIEDLKEDISQALK